MNSRRNFLKGMMGAGMALPFLESLAADAKKKQPVRVAWLYWPNGIVKGTWKPQYDSKNRITKLSSVMSPLNDYKKDIVIPGNIYINRSTIGAVVGVQPFGGRGLSGTGPKAGGPFYLHRFATEKTVTVNTTASGGNTQLISLEE